MPSPTPGRLLLSLSSLLTLVGAFLADVFSTTHIYNPRWPPHAKFHGGQTVSMSVALFALSSYLLWRPSLASAGLREREQGLWDAFLVASLYWVTQTAAGFTPGALAVDPEFGEGNPQKWLQLGFLGANVLGYALERRKLEGTGAGKKGL